MAWVFLELSVGEFAMHHPQTCQPEISQMRDIAKILTLKCVRMRETMEFYKKNAIFIFKKNTLYI